MSPTHKPKPPDKGAPPDHKPSRKVALEEVMRSLQDLVSNELAVEPAKLPGEAQATAAKTKKKTAPAETPPAAEPESIAPDRVFPAQPASTIPGVVDELPDLGAEPQPTLAGPPPGAASEVPLGGLQQELPYLEAAPPAPTVNLPAPTPEASEAETSSFLPEMLPIDEPNTDIGANNNFQASEVEEINLDDFPVLEEVVEIDTDATGHRADPDDVHATIEFLPPAAKLPPADAAHRLAIQVAARLNVELRKSGQGGLSSDIITRLARLLQEALAKGAPNMENTPSDKH